MDIVWACFMQMTNLGYVVAYLNYAKPINIRTRLITFTCVCSCCELHVNISL